MSTVVAAAVQAGSRLLDFESTRRIFVTRLEAAKRQGADGHSAIGQLLN